MNVEGKIKYALLWYVFFLFTFSIGVGLNDYFEKFYMFLIFYFIFAIPLGIFTTYALNFIKKTNLKTKQKAPKA